MHPELYFKITSEYLEIGRGDNSCKLYYAITLAERDPVLNEIANQLDVKMIDLIKLLYEFYRYFPGPGRTC